MKRILVNDVVHTAVLVLSFSPLLFSTNLRNKRGPFSNQEVSTRKDGTLALPKNYAKSFKPLLN
jgi:hypothetical protein